MLERDWSAVHLVRKVIDTAPGDAVAGRDRRVHGIPTPVQRQKRGVIAHRVIGDRAHLGRHEDERVGAYQKVDTMSENFAQASAGIRDCGDAGSLRGFIKAVAGRGRGGERNFIVAELVKDSGRKPLLSSVR